MWGWKTVERRIATGVTLDQARQVIRDHGFSEQVVNPGHVLCRRGGEQLTRKAENFPLELAIAEADSGLFLQLRYNGFVLFDTGDLETLASEMVERITGVR